jgi:hypothetical protein
VENKQYTFSISKIVLGITLGVFTYALWPQRAMYPVKIIYADENNPDYLATKDTLQAAELTLSEDKREVLGNWKLVCKAAHVTKDGVTRESMNTISLVAV